MATLYTQQTKNVQKTWSLMAVFMVIVVLLGWFISYYFRNENILWFASIFALGMNVLSYWYSDKITMSLAGAKPTTRDQYPDFYRAV